MASKTLCPTCGRGYDLADEHVGRKGRCHKCNTLFRIASGKGLLLTTGRPPEVSAKAAQPSVPSAPEKPAAPAQTVKSQEVEPGEALVLEERRQFDRLRGLVSQMDAKLRETTTLDAFMCLFVVYTEMLKLRPDNRDALRQAYRLCCQWSPVLDPEQRKSFFSVYCDAGAALQHKIGAHRGAFDDKDEREVCSICEGWAYHVMGTIHPEFTESARAAIPGFVKYSMDEGLAFEISGSTRADAFCLLAHNRLSQLTTTGSAAETESRNERCAKEARQLFATALTKDTNCIDAILGLFALSGDGSLLDRAKQIDAPAVFRATFGRCG